MSQAKQHTRLLDAITPDFAVGRGRPQPFGVSHLACGVNFAVFSRHASTVTLVLFRPGVVEPFVEFPFDNALNRTGDVWHICVQGLVPGFEYGYRMSGPKDEANLHRFN
ncbi:MAG: hypothetical protein OET90_11545, partial [Desulfuromonadales bacterium]|nr:hypothetical protein [Desulfuromonadales bacterium]